MPSKREANAVLDRDFLETRSRILEVAAALDRIDRAPVPNRRPARPPPCPAPPGHRSPSQARPRPRRDCPASLLTRLRPILARRERFAIGTLLTRILPSGGREFGRRELWQARRRETNRRLSRMKPEPLVEDIQNYALNIVDTVREPLLILDATLRVRSANRAFYQTFQVSAEETVDRLIYELGNGQWDIPDLRKTARRHRPQEFRLQRFRAGAHISGHRPQGDAAQCPQASGGPARRVAGTGHGRRDRASGRKRRCSKPERCKARSSTAPTSRASPPTRRASFKSSTSAPSACWAIRPPK